MIFIFHNYTCKIYPGMDSKQKHVLLKKCVNGIQIILHFFIGYILCHNFLVNGTLSKFFKQNFQPVAYTV